MAEKAILYLGGGAMSGIFGAGVVEALQEKNFYDKVYAIYGTSAGVFNGAYFLSRQSSLGSSIYYENLVHRFLFPHHIIPGALQRLWNGYISTLAPEKLLNAMDVEYILTITQKEKPLNIAALRAQTIPLYAKLLNVKSGKIEYHDITKEDNPWLVLKAAISMVPYYFYAQRIQDSLYVDGSIKEPIGLSYLLKKYPTCKIIAVINIPIHRKWKNYLSNFLEGIVARAMYGEKLYSSFLHRENSIRLDIRIALEENKRVLLISPPRQNATTVWTTSEAALLATHAMGVKAAEQIQSFILS
jgi:predicted patatin/cPLA2 family phospholipase